MVLGLVGCGNTTKNEEEILQDLQSECDVFETYCLEISSIEITNRKTNSAGKSDVVYCSIVAQNDDMKYTCDYIITYFLYDQGWLVEKIKKENEQKIPLSTSIIQEQASNDAKQYLEQLSYEYQTSFSFDKEVIELDKGIHKFYFIDQSQKMQSIVEYSFNGTWSLSGFWHEEINK